MFIVGLVIGLLPGFIIGTLVQTHTTISMIKNDPEGFQAKVEDTKKALEYIDNIKKMK